MNLQLLQDIFLGSLVTGFSYKKARLRATVMPFYKWQLIRTRNNSWFIYVSSSHSVMLRINIILCFPTFSHSHSLFASIRKIPTPWLFPYPHPRHHHDHLSETVKIYKGTITRLTWAIHIIPYSFLCCFDLWIFVLD